MAGIVDLVCSELSMDRLCDTTDIVFLALPHKLPMALVPELMSRGKMVIDLSADFRFKNVHTYEAHYQLHTARDYVEKAVYGLSEVYFDRIRSARLIGNPGCYPTSVLLPLVPLIKGGQVHSDGIIADSKSGVSGAGRSVSLTTHYCQVNDSFKAYKVAAHRHNPEMEAVLSDVAGKPVRISFAPHLVPMSRGMLTTLYAPLTKPMAAAEVVNALAEFYAGRRFVRLCPGDLLPDTMNVRGTNYCDIGVRVDERCNRLILISAIDNLVKGAAGQAVQNMNIMLGRDEAEGFEGVPYPI
jgi:N-acetyl-gamma-glutamyl-phosphate reductase